MKSYRELLVWQKSIELVEKIYILTKTFPKSEQFGLTSQIRRAAISIPANIAEGYARKHRAEYIQFLRIAFGSGAEIETYTVIVKKLNYASQNDITHIEELLNEIMRMLNALITSLVAKP